jgi:hypothetical protein
LSYTILEDINGEESLRLIHIYSIHSPQGVESRGKWNLSVSKIVTHDIGIIHIGMFIQNTEEVIRVNDLSTVLRIVILKESEEGFIANPFAQGLQKVRAVKIDSVLVVIVI